MTGDPLPDTDHVVRYCPPLRTENGLPTTAAFQPRGGEHYISTNWLEFFKGADMATNLKHVRVAVGAKLTLSRNGLFAVLNVGAARAAGNKYHDNYIITGMTRDAFDRLEAIRIRAAGLKKRETPSEVWAARL